MPPVFRCQLAVLHSPSAFLFRALGQPLSLGVGLVPEVGKKDKKECSVHPHEVDEDGELVITVIHEVVLVDVERDNNELDQLDGCHVLFPPEIFLKRWTSCRQAVVEVHDDVDNRVHHSMEGSHTTWSKLDSPPPGPGHDRVVKDVKKGNLAVLFPQNKEYCVKQLYKLGK